MSFLDQPWTPTSVQVTVLQARGLRAKGKGGTNDAYALMQVGKDKYQTSMVEKSVAPVWKEEAAFELPQQGAAGGRGTLHVHVLHRALVGLDKLLGQAVIDLQLLAQEKNRNKSEWFKLLDKNGKADKDRGEVLVDIQFLRNNMTASMFDLSAVGKSRSRLGKLKDKVRGKKKEPDAASPSITQVLTESEEDDDVDEGKVPISKEKKRLKIKSIFSHKSNLQRNLSQSMTVLPDKNSSLSGSLSSGLNVDTSEGKKKFRFMKHKHSDSSDPKGSSQKHATLEKSNLCINGSHVYCEEPPPRTSRVGSNFSLSSSGLGSMEDVPENSPPSVDSLPVIRQYTPWEEEEEDEEEQEKIEVDGLTDEKERTKEDTWKELEEEQEKEESQEDVRKQEVEGVEKQEEDEEEEEEDEMLRREEVHRLEEERLRLDEEKERKERELNEEAERLRNLELERLEAEKWRREEEEKREEERARMEEEEEQEQLAMERRREEEKMREEEMARIEEEEQERLAMEEEKRREEERARQEEEEQEQRREEQERLALEKRLEEEERKRVEAEKVRLAEEEKRRQDEEEQLALVKKREEEEEKIREAERLKRHEVERLEVEKKRQEKEEERRRAEEKQRLAEEQQRVQQLELERLKKEKEKLEEEKRRVEEEARKKEEERVRRREEQKRLEEEEQRRLEEEEERRRNEEKEEEERERMAEEERKRQAEKRRKEEEEERLRNEEQELKRQEAQLVEEKRKMEEKAQEQKMNEEKKESEEIEHVEKEENGRIDDDVRKEEVPKKLKDDDKMDEACEEKSNQKAKTVLQDTQMDSSNPFDEGLPDNPFDDDLPNPFFRSKNRTSDQNIQKSCASSETSLGSNNTTTDKKHTPSTLNQREKRAAPQPPGKTRTNIPADSTVPSKPAVEPLKDKQSKNTSPATSPQNKSPTPEQKAAPPKPAKRLAPSIPSADSKPVSATPTLNPFDDDDGGGNEQGTKDPGFVVQAPPVSQIPNPNAVSQNKVKSMKVARAPVPPAKSVVVASKPPTLQSSGVEIQASVVGKVLESQENPLKESKTTKMLQNGQDPGEKKDPPPAPARRLQPVKPLSQEQHPLKETQDEKVMVSVNKEKGPYSMLTREELTSLVEKQEKQLQNKDKRIAELEQYIDNLLLRVMEEQPSILMSMKKVI
ncbi:uncharacterized protein LOC144210815 [Stigmatopora nigra]